MTGLLAPRDTERAERLAPMAELSGFGSMLKYARQPLLRFEAARRVSDRAVAFEVLGRSYITLFDLDAIEQVLVSRHAAFRKDGYTLDLRRVLGEGLLTSDGELWRQRRKLLAPSFQRGEIPAYAAVMAERARAFISEQPRGVTFDVHSAMMHLTLDILVRALFGTQLARADEVERLLEAVAREYRPSVIIWRLVLPEWLPVPSRARLSRIRGELDAILLALIAERRAHEPGAAAAPADLLGRLMQAFDAGESTSERALRDEAMTLFLAGHETTALSLTYALRLLALHPEQAERLRAELAEVLSGRLPSLEDLPRLARTRAVLDEAMRLYPPAWAIGRQPIEDTAVAGIAIPKGTQVLISPWVLHRDSRFHADPARFLPERWLGSPPPPRFAYMPFGAGPRVCIGSHFALAEAAIVLATLLQAARFELLPQPELALTASVTLRPRGPVLMRALPWAGAA